MLRWIRVDMPQLSLRMALAYAGSLLSQFPTSREPPNPSRLLETNVDAVPYVPLSGAPSCPLNGPTTCRNSTPAGDSCCIVCPRGRLIMTQFWDHAVNAVGSEEDWTLHGLWYVLFPIP